MAWKRKTQVNDYGKFRRKSSDVLNQSHFVNYAILSDWKKAIVVPIYKQADQLVVGNYRQVSLTSVVCKQMEHVIAGYLRQVWEISGWLYEGQHGFRPGTHAKVK